LGEILLLNPITTSNLSYDPLKDFAPITLASKNTSLLNIRAEDGPKTVKELIARVKASPGKLNCGAGIIMTGLAGYLFNRKAGLAVRRGDGLAAASWMPSDRRGRSRQALLRPQRCPPSARKARGRAPFHHRAPRGGARAATLPLRERSLPMLPRLARNRNGRPQLRSAGLTSPRGPSLAT